MASHLSVPKPDLKRTRSSSSPLGVLKAEEDQNVSRPSRPTHTRSRSYMSPVDPKVTTAATFPAPEKTETSRFHRLHLHSRHHHNNQPPTNEDAKSSHKHHGRQKYTQSESQQYHKKRDSTMRDGGASGTPISTAPPSHTSEQPNDLLYPSSRGTAIPSLMRMASTRSHRAYPSVDITMHGLAGVDPRSGLRRRATSDPRAPAPDQSRPHPKSPIELQLERADLLRRATIENTTETDLKLLDTQLRTAGEELQSRLMNTTRTASDLMRRLDDAQETLLRTTESLVDTISSFSTLSDQSSKLIENFEHETQHLDRDTRKRITHFSNAICKGRGKRVEELEKRGKAMNQKAKDLERRLENCRVIVANWEEREMNKRKAWRGVWVGVLWGVGLILLAVLIGVVGWKAVEIHGEEGTAVDKVRRMTVENASYDVALLEKLNLPRDVREVLVDIDTRARQRQTLPVPATHMDVDVERNDAKRKADESRHDKSLKLFDEL